MTQFNEKEAKRIFKLYPEANYVAQDEFGDVYYYTQEPILREIYWICRDWIPNGSKSLGRFYLHPEGWENSLYSRADMEGE